MRSGSSRLSAGAAALALLLATSGTAAAADELWSLTPTAVTVVQGQSGTTTFTATNLTPAAAIPAVVGCVKLNVPSSFTVHSVAIASATDGSWTTAKQGTAVLVQAVSPANSLEFGESVRFAITATPNAVSTFNFNGTAYESTSCSPPAFGSVVVADVTVVPASAATPTPVPTVVQTPVPTAVPTPIATPTPARTSGPTRSPNPSPTPSPSAAASASATPTELPTTTPAETGTASPSFGPSGLTIGFGSRPGSGDDASVDVSLATSLDGIVWSVPAVAVGFPGVAVILWVAAQTAGGVVWLPWVRRLRRPRDRHRAAASPH